MEKLSILILDDEKYIRDELKESLTDYDFKVKSSEKPSTAFQILSESEIDILILDINLPEMSGLEVLEKVKQDYPEVEVIMITGQSDIDYAINALRLGVADFFLKPFSITDVVLSIKKTERYKNLNQKLNQKILENQLLHKKIGENTKIIGNSQAILQVLSLMNEVAKYPETNVLVTGESGTGKELVARGIHNLSSRSNEICYAVNCAAIPEHLFESELFGHEKGAYTGASALKTGYFELTKDGTLILDEITEMPLNLQAKLLRVLEEKTISRIGSHHQIKLNSRIIATSNRDISKLVEEGKFREDLFHRLNVFNIYTPPLKERKNDIPEITRFLSHNICIKLRKKNLEIDDSAINTLSKYNFPGNIRELRNILERAIILNSTGRLTSNDLNFLKIKETELDTQDYTLDLELNEINLIKKALLISAGNKLQSAKLLNISWQSLDRRLKKYNIN